MFITPGDYQKCGTSRAILEMSKSSIIIQKQDCNNYSKSRIVLCNAAVKTIASNPDYTPLDNVKFFDCLRKLINYCKFNVNNTCDEQNRKYRPLLLR